MTTLLTLIGVWFIAAAAAGAGFALKRQGLGAAAGADVLFGCAGLGVLALLLAQMVAR